MTTPDHCQGDDRRPRKFSRLALCEDVDVAFDFFADVAGLGIFTVPNHTTQSLTRSCSLISEASKGDAPRMRNDEIAMIVPMLLARKNRARLTSFIAAAEDDLSIALKENRGLGSSCSVLRVFSQTP
jgi:hypothetical protein